MENIFSLEGKIALVTGATKGIGLEIAAALASQGATIVTNNRYVENRTEANIFIKKRGVDMHMYECDVTDGSAIEHFIEKIEKKLGPIEILVNNAGIIKRVPAHEMEDEDFREVIDVNLTGAFLMSKYVGRRMIEYKRGKIINICSLMSELGRDTVSAYAASKGGLKMLTRNLATEWGRYNIQVNGIGPGYIKTRLTESFSTPGHPFNEFILRRTPLNRWGEPQDLAGTAIFLASKTSDFVTGQIIYVDGGIMASLGRPDNEQ